MGLIKLLDKSVYNRLSAGEVVENPASVVKELVENSIDAGARFIRVEIEDGGIKSISVADNGCGIQREDLPLMINSHSTSKIRSAQDLNYISTLGFRGEALASIASVSKMNIKSRFVEDKIAYEMIVEGGEILEIKECNLVGGTSIEVNSLFYNTPARYKFLKTQKGEEQAITKLMYEFVLANPYVAFSYEIDGKQLFYASGTTRDASMHAVFGQDVLNNLLYFEAEEKGYTIKGYVGRPASSAVVGNRAKQTFIVNGRIFDSPTLSATIKNAYGDRLMTRTFPIAVVDIVMPFDLLDVNVHPSKREVRFAENRVVNGIIYNAVKFVIEEDEYKRQKELEYEMSLTPQKKQAIQDALEVATSFEKRRKKKNVDLSVLEDGYIFIHKDGTASFKKNIPEFRNDGKIPDDEYNKGYITRDLVSGHETEPYTHPPHIDAQVEQNQYNTDIKDSIDEFISAYNDEGEEQYVFKDIETIEERVREENDESRPKYRIVGQIFDTYLVVECARNLFIIDQHAAHEKILYDNFLESLKKHVEVQSFFHPIIKRVDPADGELIELCTKSLKSIGFDIRVTHFSSLVEIYGIPCAFVGMNVDAFLDSLIEEGKEIESLIEIKEIKRKFAGMACKNAIKAGEKLNEDQIAYVMEYFLKNGMPLQCPHGRPTIVKFKQTDIEKWFRRIV